MDEWIRNHPRTAVLATWALTLLSSLIAIVCAFIATGRKFVWLLVLATATANAQIVDQENPPEEAVGWGIGVVVIVGGGVVVYKMVRFCQRHFSKPPETNAAPEEDFSGDTDYGAAWTYAPAGSCYQPASDEPERPVIFSMDCEIVNGSLRVRPGTESTNRLVGYGQWTSELAGWGLTMNPVGYSESFSHNRVPCSGAEVPIRLVPDAQHTVVIGGGTGGKIVVERSGNLVDWETVGAIALPAGVRLRLEDVGQAQASFYRVALN